MSEQKLTPEAEEWIREYTSAYLIPYVAAAIAKGMITALETPELLKAQQLYTRDEVIGFIATAFKEGKNSAQFDKEGNAPVDEWEYAKMKLPEPPKTEV